MGGNLVAQPIQGCQKRSSSSRKDVSCPDESETKELNVFFGQIETGKHGRKAVSQTGVELGRCGKVMS